MRGHVFAVCVCAMQNENQCKLCRLIADGHFGSQVIVCVCEVEGAERASRVARRFVFFFLKKKKVLH